MQPVGFMDESKTKPFTNHELTLKENDVIYTFSDGYADQFGGEKGKKFMYKKFKDLLVSVSELPMTEQKQILDETFESWRGNLEQLDDVLVIGVRIK
jgi:serine phosphatase RsbU (regulator of sigma subunit)